MKAFKKLFAILISLSLLCGGAINVSAVDLPNVDITDIEITTGIYNKAVVTMGSVWSGINMTLETAVDDEAPEICTVIYDGVGNSMLTLDPENPSTGDVYYANIGTENISAVMYVEDSAPLADGWYNFGSDTFEFYMLYSPIVDFAFLGARFDDSCFDITASGDTTTLTAKADYMNDIAYSFFGDFNSDYSTDTYSSLVIKIKNGAISSIEASNVYTAEGVTMQYEYKATFAEGDFSMVEYDDYRAIYETPAEYTELPKTGTVSSGAYYVLTPTRPTTITFTSLENEGSDPYLEIYVATEFDGYCELVHTIDDTDNSVSFDEGYQFKEGKTYYIYIDDYNEMDSFSVQTEEFFFRGKDVSGDGVCNPFDASLILRYDAMLYAFSDEQYANADANGDGLVNPFDASLFLRYDAMLIFAPED